MIKKSETFDSVRRPPPTCTVCLQARSVRSALEQKIKYKPYEMGGKKKTAINVKINRRK